MPFDSKLNSFTKKKKQRETCQRNSSFHYPPKHLDLVSSTTKRILRDSVFFCLIFAAKLIVYIISPKSRNKE